jgi:hypothetical protein
MTLLTRTLLLAAALPLSPACSGSVKDSASPDAAGGADGPISTIDAPPVASADAREGRFRCHGAPLPTEASNPVRVSGIVSTLTLTGTQPLRGVALTFVPTSQSAPSPTAMSSNDGSYSITVETNGRPVSGYVRASLSSYLTSEVYPKSSLVADIGNNGIVVINEAGRSALAQFSEVRLENNTGLATVAVLDCDGNPVSGAAVVVPGATVRYTAGGRPDVDATSTSTDGVALAFNIPPGPTTISVSADGAEFADWSAEVRANVVTAVAVVP